MILKVKLALFSFFLLCLTRKVSNVNFQNTLIPISSRTASNEECSSSISHLKSRFLFLSLARCGPSNVELDNLRIRGGEAGSDWIEDKLNQLFTDDVTSSQSSIKKKRFSDVSNSVEGIGTVYNSNLNKDVSPSTINEQIFRSISPQTANHDQEYGIHDASRLGIDQSWVRKRIDSHFATLSTNGKEFRGRSDTPDDVRDVLEREFSTDRKLHTPHPILSTADHLDTGKVIRKLQTTQLNSITPEQRRMREIVHDEDDAVFGHGNSDVDRAMLLPNLRIAKSDPNAADRMFQTILAGRLRSAVVLTQYADFLASVRRDAGSAEKHYREALGMRNDYAPALCGLGTLLLESRKDLEELERLCLLAIRHAPKHPSILCLYGRWLESIMMKPEQAEEYYRKAIEESKNLYPPALIALADLLQSRKDFGGAEAAYLEAIAVSQDDPTSYFRFGRMLLNELGRVGDAEMHFRKGLEIDGSHTDLLCHYGLLLLDFKGDTYQVC
jgi:hypothetical protein